MWERERAQRQVLTWLRMLPTRPRIFLIIYSKEHFCRLPICSNSKDPEINYSSSQFSADRSTLITNLSLWPGYGNFIRHLFYWALWRLSATNWLLLLRMLIIFIESRESNSITTPPIISSCLERTKRKPETFRDDGTLPSTIPPTHLLVSSTSLHAEGKVFQSLL